MADDQNNTGDATTHYQFGAQNHDEPEPEPEQRRGLFGRRKPKRKGVISKALDIGRESASKGIDVGGLAIGEINQTIRENQRAKYEAEVRKAELEAEAKHGADTHAAQEEIEKAKREAYEQFKSEAALREAEEQARADAKALEEQENKPEENYGGDGEREEEYMFFYRRSDDG